MELKERHVVVTGASSGIGEALALELARAGARLTLVARRRDLLEALASRCGVPCHVLARDLSEAPAADWLDAAREALGPVDVLVNNAGMENTGPMIASDVEVGRRLLRLNLEVPIVVARQLLPELLARSGAIVNVASVAAISPAPLQAWYAASKAGLATFSEALRVELQGGVGVITVYPGPVTTAMADSGYAAFGGRQGLVGLLPEGKPEVLARKIVRALALGQARVVYPATYALARLAPWFALWLTETFAPRVKPAIQTKE